MKKWLLILAMLLIPLQQVDAATTSRSVTITPRVTTTIPRVTPKPSITITPKTTTTIPAKPSISVPTPKPTITAPVSAPTSSTTVIHNYGTTAPSSGGGGFFNGFLFGTLFGNHPSQTYNSNNGQSSFTDPNYTGDGTTTGSGINWFLVILGTIVFVGVIGCFIWLVL